MRPIMRISFHDVTERYFKFLCAYHIAQKLLLLSANRPHSRPPLKLLSVALPCIQCYLTDRYREKGYLFCNNSHDAVSDPYKKSQEAPQRVIQTSSQTYTNRATSPISPERFIKAPAGLKDNIPHEFGRRAKHQERQGTLNPLGLYCPLLFSSDSPRHVRL